MVNFEFNVEDLEQSFSVKDTDLLKVQVGMDGTVKIFGSIDRKNFEALSAVNDSNLSISSTISKKGLYSVDINGLELIKVSKSSKDIPVTLVGVN